MYTQEAFIRVTNSLKSIEPILSDPNNRWGGLIDEEEIELLNINDPDERQKRDAVCIALRMLTDVKADMDYFLKPIKETGVLQRNSNGRFELNGTELTSGSIIEILIEEPDEHPQWVKTRIEFDFDYYALYRHLPLNDLKARYR